MHTKYSLATMLVIVVAEVAAEIAVILFALWVAPPRWFWWLNAVVVVIIARHIYLLYRDWRDTQRLQRLTGQKEQR